jgi:hypothetical protein
MPTGSTHLAQAARNKTLALAIVDDYPDWAVVVLFYAALHLVDAYLARSNVHPRSQGDWGIYVDRSSLRSIAASYHQLQDRSRDARYNAQPFTPLQFQLLHQRHFLPLKRHIDGLLSRH